MKNLQNKVSRIYKPSEAKDKRKVKALKPGAGQKKGGGQFVKKEDLMRLQLSKDKVAD
jgi:hypothetical protein